MTGGVHDMTGGVHGMTGGVPLLFQAPADCDALLEQILAGVLFQRM